MWKRFEIVNRHDSYAFNVSSAEHTSAARGRVFELGNVVPRDDAQLTLTNCVASSTGINFHVTTVNGAQRQTRAQRSNQTRLAAAGRPGQHQQSLRSRQVRVTARLLLLLLPLLMLLEQDEVGVQPFADLGHLASVQAQIALMDSHTRLQCKC